MGLNAFFAFVIAPQYGWQAALGAVLISGIVFIILSVTGAIGYIDAAVPTTLKRAVAAGIGLFIAYIGLQSGGIIVSDEATQVALSDPVSYTHLGKPSRMHKLCRGKQI